MTNSSPATAVGAEAGSRFLSPFARLGSVAVLFVLVLALGSPQGFGQESEELKQRILQEAPSRSEEYVRLSGELQGVLSISNTGTIDDGEYHAHMEYQTNGKGKVLKVVTKSTSKGMVEQDDEEVYGLNPRYAFTLKRKSSSSPWILTDLIKRSSSTDLGRVGFCLNEYLRCVTYGVLLDHEPLAEVVHKPGFQIGQCRKVQRNGEDLVETAFTYTKVESKGKKSTLKGTLFFAPNRYWCMRSGEIQETGDIVSGTQKFQLTQVDNGGVLPPLSRLYESDGDYVSSYGEKNRQRIRSDVTLRQVTPLPSDEEFTLTAFGLPEPAGMEQPLNRWYLWAALAGIICLGLAALLGWWTRRTRTISKGPQPEGP
jgi:hypothetical protein